MSQSLNRAASSTHAGTLKSQSPSPSLGLEGSESRSSHCPHGSAMDRLLASRFASERAATASSPADSASDAALPKAQPPPTLEGQVALMS